MGMKPVEWTPNSLRDGVPTPDLAPFGRDAAKEVLAYHQSWPRYGATPLHSLDGLASRLSIRGILVKDEAGRFGLNAFKGLGGTRGLGPFLTGYYGLTTPVSYEALQSRAGTRPPVVFATATDGNHGVGVSWAARMLGHRARVYMPQGSAPSRVSAITAAGGEVTVTDSGYDETVAQAADAARREGFVLAQDTVWQGQVEMPRSIMQGYLTLWSEILASADGNAVEPPTHVILQAGVGSFAAASVALLANLFAGRMPIIVLVEPTRAACFYRSAVTGDGGLRAVEGPLDTIMAGLACGVGNPLAWEILRHWVDVFVRVEDAVTARGMRILGSPVPGDPPIVAGESGAVGLGLLAAALDGPDAEDLRGGLRLDGASRVLLVNTEGATDPVMYHRIVWDGYEPWTPAAGRRAQDSD